jgi:proteasome accessory factor B
MDRTERLLDLVALLLDAREPTSWAELREQFPDDYGKGSDEAAERKFERDKAELLELGIPITYVQGDDDRKDGYIVDREAYYLPEAGLTPEELAVLYAAGSAALSSGAFPAQGDLAHALRKIGFYAREELSPPRVRMELGSISSGAEVARKLDALWGAASGRKWVQMTYFSPRENSVTHRKVDPYGLALRQGIWSLVGYCHLRKDLRTFQVHRIRELELNAAKPRSPDFEVPATFKLDNYVATHPWQHRIHAPVKVELSLSEELAAQKDALFPGAEGGPSQPTIVVTYLEGLLRHVLPLGPGCQVQGPPEAVEQWRRLARRVYEAHA